MAGRNPNAKARRTRSCRQGFSLIELMVVVTVLAVLAAIAAPSMRELVAAQRVRSVASDLHMALLRTRSEAIKRNTQVTLKSVGGSWGAGWTIVNPEDAAGPGLQTQSAPPSSVTIAATPDTLTEMVYSGSGRTTLAAGAESKFVISSANSSHERCVLVDSSGRPYVREGSSC